MTKVTLNDVANLQNETTAVNTINSNSAVIETAFDNTVSRDGTSPNQMNAALDMNNNQIINLPAPSTVNSPARLIDVVTNPTIVIPGTGTSGHVVPFLDGNNTWSGTNTFSGGISGNTTASGTFSATKYLIGSDIVLTHPLTPSPDNVANSIITLGVGAGSALTPIHSTQYITLLGFSAGTSLTTADHITAVGAFALASYVSGPTPAGMTAVGVDSQRNLTSGSLNTTFGEHTFTQATAFSSVTGVGYGAGLNIGGTYNTMFGIAAGQGVAGMTGDYNVGLGPVALNGISGTASGNIAVGAFAGAGISTGGNNIVIGRNAGAVLNNGNNNILIGTAMDTPIASTNGYLNIGGWIFGDAVNNVKFVGSISTKVLGTLTGTAGTVAINESNLIISSSGTFTITLPDPTLWPGRWLLLKNVVANALNSASANVVPLVGGAAGTAILTAATGKWAWMQSDGANWAIMAAN